MKDRSRQRYAGSPSIPGLHRANRACARGLREELGALKVIYKGAQLMCHVILSSSCLPSSLVRFQPQESPFPFFPQTAFVSIAILIPLSNALF